MIPYSFCVLRYIHDGVTGEFVNIGVALFSADVPYLKSKCTIQYGRITRVFDRIDGDRFKQNVRYIEEAVNQLGHRLRQGLLPFTETVPVTGSTVAAIAEMVELNIANSAIPTLPSRMSHS